MDASEMLDFLRVQRGDCWQHCDQDCELGEMHCEWAHLPSHKRGWHSQEDCPHKQARQT